MGLLTTDQHHNESKLIKLFKTQSTNLSTFCFVFGFICCFYLINEKYVAHTYFSDNALLPGLVNREYNQANLAQQIYKDLLIESQKLSFKFPHYFIHEQFRKLGLHVYQHNYTFTYPFGLKQTFNGTNIYAILRAPRSASTEALVLSSPYLASINALNKSLAGIALMISLAKYFYLKNYWSKDIIFLVTDHELIGFQAWLNAYHQIESSSFSNNEILEARSGPIQAAINLEIHSDFNSRIDIKIEGLNGQLPNLDLFNVAVELCTRESIPATFHGISHQFSDDFYKILTSYATTIASMMIAQASTFPTGAHGLFQKFGIQSLTLNAIEIKQSSDKDAYLTVSFLQMGRAIEGIFRSLNNLLEKFNRSYWFYLLASTRRYISIGYYLIPFTFFALPLIFQTLNIYLKMISKHNFENNKKEVFLWPTISFTFMTHFFGLCLALLPYLLERYAFFLVDHSLQTKDVLYFSLLTFSLICMFNPLISLSKKNLKQKSIHRYIAFLNLSLLLGCLSLLNFSLAFGLNLIYVPIFSMVGVTVKNVFSKIRKVLSYLLLVLHPLPFSYLCLFAVSFWYDIKLTFFQHLIKTFYVHKKLVLHFVNDWYFYGNWTYIFATAFLFPVWLQFWYLL